VTYTPDSAGRLVSAADGNGTNYVTSASYNPDGSLKNLLNGSTPALNQSFQYTPRLQMCRITALTSGTLPTSCTDTQNIGNVMDRGYNFNYGAGDNGNVISITNYRDANRSQAFTYDSLNRLISAWSSANTGAYSWGENYSLDAWGNLQISPMGSKAHGGNFQVSGNAQNRPTGLAYDASGNLMSYLSAAYTYDQENRLSSTAGMSYTYDGNGERVLKSNTSGGTAVKRYWSMGGNTLAEGDGSGNLTAEYIYFGDKRVARIDLSANTVHYYLSDHLGSTNLVANSAGAVEEESDYYPFGTEVVVTSGSNLYKLTGKERDQESGLDLMGLRYNGPTLGRFTSPDPEFASSDRIADPQQWNMYAYARNNPLSITDPTGLDFNLTCSGGNPATCQNGIQGQTTTDANGKSTFTATDVDMNDPKDASGGYHDQFGNQYTGSFDENNGVTFTNTTTGATSSNSRFIDGSDETDINGSATGAFNGIQGRFNSNCGGSCEAKGSLYNLPGHDGALANLEKKIGASLEDNLNFFGGHGKSISFRFGEDQLTHIVNHLGGPDAGKQEVHFEGHAPGRDLANFVLHQVDAIKDSANHQSAQEPRLP
jgi:RHS repeat-associated protein